MTFEENSFGGVEEVEELNCRKTGVNRRARSEYRKLLEEICQKSHLFPVMFLEWALLGYNLRGSS